MLRAELLINTADSTENIYKAITISNNNPIIGAFKIEKNVGKASRIKVTSFFNEDNPALGMPAYMKKQYNLSNQVGDLSFIESIKTFPMNTEVRLVKTWNSATGNLPPLQPDAPPSD